jgi:hypothetical protein
MRPSLAECADLQPGVRARNLAERRQPHVLEAVMLPAGQSAVGVLAAQIDQVVHAVLRHRAIPKTGSSLRHAALEARAQMPDQPAALKIN